MSCIVMDYYFRARVPESIVFYRFFCFWNFSRSLFFIFFLKCILAVKLRRRSRRTWQD